jgi:hypothetical protein
MNAWHCAVEGRGAGDGVRDAAGEAKLREVGYGG